MISRATLAGTVRSRRHRGIAERIGSPLTGEGYDVGMRPARDSRGPSTYDAIVIGSAAYMGR